MGDAARTPVLPLLAASVEGFFRLWGRRHCGAEAIRDALSRSSAPSPYLVEAVEDARDASRTDARGRPPSKRAACTARAASSRAVAATGGRPCLGAATTATREKCRRKVSSHRRT